MHFPKAVHSVEELFTHEESTNSRAPVEPPSNLSMPGCALLALLGEPLNYLSLHSRYKTHLNNVFFRYSFCLISLKNSAFLVSSPQKGTSEAEGLLTYAGLIESPL